MNIDPPQDAADNDEARALSESRDVLVISEDGTETPDEGPSIFDCP